MTFIKVNRIMESFRRIELNDGGSIPTVAFGTGTSYFNRVDDVAEGIIKAVKIGYRWIDTAVLYGTEVGVGKGIKTVLEENLCKREDLFITTKVTPNKWRHQEVRQDLLLLHINHGLFFAYTQAIIVRETHL